MECLEEKAKYSIKHKIFYHIANNGNYKSEHVIEDAAESIWGNILMLLVSVSILIISLCRKEIAEKYNHNRRGSGHHIK